MISVRVAADRTVCIGSGNCAYAAPATFDQDDEGLVVVLTEQVAEADAGVVRTAVAHCPSGALRLQG